MGAPDLSRATEMEERFAHEDTPQTIGLSAHGAHEDTRCTGPTPSVLLALWARRHNSIGRGWLDNSPGREAPRLRAAMRIMGWRPSSLLEELGAPHVTTEGTELFPSPAQVLTMAPRG